MWRAAVIVAPGEVLVEGERIRASGSVVPRPARSRVIDLGDVTLLPGLIDAHVHLCSCIRARKTCRP
jgi:imidazolonepropionase-like amidohydrolase